MLCLISSHAYMLQRWMLILSVAKTNDARLRLIFFNSYLHMMSVEKDLQKIVKHVLLFRVGQPIQRKVVMKH